MALWTGLGQAATVAQLVGADVGGLISMIMQVALTARQNKKECEQLARRVLMIAQLLPHVQQDPEAAQQLAGLGDTLREAHELVVSCQGRSAAYQLVMAGRQAESFREVQSKIEFYLIVFPVISHIGITRRLERIYNVLVQDDTTRAEPSQLQQSSEVQVSIEVAQEVVPHGTQEFTFAEIMAATNNFSLDSMIGEGGSGTVYRGRLQDGREVAVKRMKNMQSSNLQEEFHSNTFRNYGSSNLQEEFHTELDILSRLRHKHIIRLLGSCVTVSKDKHHQATTQKKKKGMPRRRRKVPEEPERLIVYEYMQNGTLFDHLHPDHNSCTLSPVTLSWKMRINVLLGVARAMEHLHCHANPPIIHRDCKLANILFDVNWVPHVSDFGSSVSWDMAVEVSEVVGTVGYMAPEYMAHGHLSPTIDVYSLGVVMLEVLTGKRAFSQERTFGALYILPNFLDKQPVPIVPDLLDRRPVPEPAPWQLQALKRVEWTARCCVKLDAKKRLAISDVVASLEMAHELICRDEPGSVDEPGCLEMAHELICRDEPGSVDAPGLVDEFPTAFWYTPPVSPRSNSVSSAGFEYQSDLESEVLEEGR